MFIVIRKRLFAGAGLVFFLIFAALLWSGTRRSAMVFSPGMLSPVTVVVDPGHGGEDGGAVSANGVAESGINLAVSRRLCDLLRLMGERVVMTREEDVSLGDPDLATIRQRKASDIRRRVELVNGADNAVLLSIHQNSLPSSPETHGAQVFWNRQGEELAKRIQDSLNEAVNTEREKQAREIPSSIYLMSHVTVPAALVECGFLSNTAEAARLREPSCQQKLAVAIAAGYLHATAEEGVL